MRSSPSTEDRLLGGLLRWPAAVDASLLSLEPRHFGMQGNRLVFQAVAALRQREAWIDLVTVYERLREGGQVIEAGGGSWLAHLWECACNPDEIARLAGALVREDLPEPSACAFTPEPELPMDPPEVDTLFNFGANPPPQSDE